MIEPCHTCHRPVERAGNTLGAHAYCDTCRQTLLTPIRNRILTDESGTGTGQRVSNWRHDHGPHMADLECTLCDATWIGTPGDTCNWCLQRDEHMRQRQRHLTLTPPDWPLEGSLRREQLMAWRDRLKAAVNAEIVTEHEAAAAFRRAQEQKAA